MNATDQKPALVGIVLVNYNGMKFLPDCLESLSKIDYKKARVICVDNASTDGSADWVEANFPNVLLLRMRTNTGITGGNNAGMKWCMDNGVDYILLLNNDTVVQPDFLSRLMEYAESATMLAPKIYFYDRPDRINNNIGAFNYWRGTHINWFYGKTDSSETMCPCFVEMANTCALLFSRMVVEKVGYMDDAYFLYYDDDDFITRALSFGIKIRFVPQSVIYHRESSTSGGMDSPLTLYYMNRNRLYFTFKHQRNFALLAYFTMYFYTTRMLNMAIYVLTGRLAQAFAAYRGIRDYYAKRMGFTPAACFALRANASNTRGQPPSKIKNG